MPRIPLVGIPTWVTHPPSAVMPLVLSPDHLTAVWVTSVPDFAMVELLQRHAPGFQALPADVDERIATFAGQYAIVINHEERDVVMIHTTVLMASSKLLLEGLFGRLVFGIHPGDDRIIFLSEVEQVYRRFMGHVSLRVFTSEFLTLVAPSS